MSAMSDMLAECHATYGLLIRSVPTVPPPYECSLRIGIASVLGLAA